MVYLEFLGFIAGFFSTIAFIPQVYKTWKTKAAKDVSIQMFILYIMGNILWIIYGVIFEKPAIYVTNIVVFILASIQIILKIKYDRTDKTTLK
ncbi:MAG: SemiSWEET transporter [Endomicrobium sp.]|jgi:MtN3 and saliva related transmembrane protein|nr:SemiSWEET transporter [Endomicrobium sp.]